MNEAQKETNNQLLVMLGSFITEHLYVNGFGEEAVLVADLDQFIKENFVPEDL